MRQGKTIQELAVEVARQSSVRKDYVLDTKALAMTVHEEGGVALEFEAGDGRQRMRLTPHCQEQIASHLKIPQEFCRRLSTQHPDILAGVVTPLLQREPARRMLRVLDGNARAFLSDRYRRIDNWDVMETVMPILAGLPSAAMASCEITDSRLHLKVTVDEVRGWVDYQKPGTHERIRQEVRSGFYVSNSEVGRGAYSVRPFCEVLVCTNGMVIDELAQRVRHAGRRHELEDEIPAALLSDKTRMIEDAAVLSRTRDLVNAVLDPKKFAETVDRMSAAGGDAIDGDVVKVIDVTADRYDLAEAEKSSVMQHLIRGGDLSRWGLLNAVTRTAQDASTYDRATELESLGGQLLAMTADDWRAFNRN